MAASRDSTTICANLNIRANEFVRVYKCLCDLTRLRILSLLLDGPLCVCHIQSILRAPEPKVSRQLNVMKRSGLLESSRENNWSIYRISSSRGSVLVSNLKCLQDARHEHAIFRQDLERRRRVIARLRGTERCLPSAVAKACAPLVGCSFAEIHEQEPP